MPSSSRRSLALPVGALLVLLAVCSTISILERTVLPADTIQPHSRRAVALGLCRISLAVAGLLVLWRRPRVTVVHLCAFGLVGFLSALLGALALQVAFRPPPVRCGWRSFAPASEQNQFGFRGRNMDESAADTVIILLGDSHVESMALALDRMPERRLEAHLQALGRTAKVRSLGAGGYGQDQELLVLQEYFQKHRADMVVVWQTPGNDVWNNLFKTHMVNRNPKPTYWLEGGKLEGPSERMEELLAVSPIVVASLWQRVFALPRRDRQWEAGLPEPYHPLDHYDGPLNREWQERWNTNRGLMRAENLATEKTHMATMLAPRSKRTEYGLALTHALLQRIGEVTAAQGGAMVVLQVDDQPIVSDADQIYVLNGKYYKVSKRQFEENWAQAHQGLAREVVPVTVKDWRVAPDDAHYNDAATDQIMHDLAARLLPRLSSKRP